MRMAESQIYVPDGLVTMLEGLARSVLKKRPEDIPLFALYYFAKLKEFRKGHPHFHIKKLVKEFHNGAAGTLFVVGLEEELQRMGYLKPASVKSDHTAESVRIPCHVKITIIPDELLSQENVSQDKCDRGAFPYATTQPVYQESLSTAVSCTESVPNTNYVPLLSLSTHTKLSTCVDNSDVTTAVGGPLAGGDSLTIQKTAERVLSEASTASVYQMSKEETIVKTTPCYPCNVPRAEVTKTRLAQPKATTATEVSVCSVRCQTSVVPQNKQQPTTGIAGGQGTQDSPSYEASQVIHDTSLTARQENPVVSLLPETAQTECAVQPSNTREQLSSSMWGGGGACNHPAHPLTQYPCSPWNSWNPSFCDRCVYPSYNQPLYYPYYLYHPAYGQILYYSPYYPYHREQACCSYSSYRCDSSAQKPDQRNFYALRGFSPPMPFYQPFPMPSNHCTCRHHLPGVRMPVPSCLSMKPHQTTQMEATHFKQTSTRMSPTRQVQPVNGHPSMHPPHRYIPPFALMGRHPLAATPQHFQSPAYPAVPLPGEEMDNADQNAARQSPYTAPLHRGDSHCHIDSNNN
ncbi:hypothetical protein AALO_G00128940 [Alosa alosa]|uniref:RIIa domain-containing protein n=1 Tax=Alosa alosa TaxID=278164 RepID=A0AAV6GS32_9TELE|nr:uncharacterized protein LOC125300981 [Alosa alosa]XP_048109160.1 uncharacterized protein LOC125300981 [Alosa alosa]KAG5276187.1 hypothetical protein AALO_G00128940 [Alosa alosa]